MAAPGNNVVIGFDTINTRVRILTVPGISYQRATIDYVDFDGKLLDTGDYVSIMEQVLSKYDIAKFQGSVISIVLPNCLVGVDYVGIPTMKRNKMDEAINIEFKALYKNNESLQMIPVPILSSKKNALYMLLITNRPMLNGITQLFTSNKLQVRVKTFEANGYTNSVLQLRPKSRRANFIFVDIKENSTSFSVVNKERTVGFQNLPYGYNILSRTEINSESMLIDHDVAELAAINANELAKKKKLTVTEEDAEEIEEAANAENAEASENNSENQNSEQSENEEKNDEQTENTDENAELSENAEEQKAEEVKKPVVKVFAKKTPKALPMFMQRPIPETEEGYILENFRIFEKRILLLKRFCDYDNIMPNPEFIVINMPKEFEFVIESLNLDEDNGIEFRYFSPETEGSDVVADNLDLVGALFAGTWNKTHNFM